jgi:phage FluMu protein Com
MTDRPASWRMPTPNQMEKLAAEAANKAANPAAAPDAPLPAEYWDSVLKDPRAVADARMRQRKLSELQRHVLRVSCRRCERTVEIQTIDAVRLYGGNAVWKDVAQRLLDGTCQQRTGRHEEEPIDPSPTIDQAVNGGFPWLEIQCARCKTPSDVDLAAMKHPPTTFVHDLAGRLRCRKCAKAGRRPAATLLQLASKPRHPRT